MPEQMFSDPDNPTDGVSAVKALQLAAQQGQKIYQIDQNNLNAVLNDISLDITVENEIRGVVNQGRIAIAHTNNITVPGWTGAGYLILDPDTMVGSYKISGGGNGGFFAALGYILATVSMFLDFLESYAAAFGTALPILTNVNRFLTVANLVYGLLETGANCAGGDLSPVLFVISLFSILTLSIVSIVSAVANPLAAFATGIILDRATGWLVNQAQNCQ